MTAQARSRWRKRLDFLLAEEALKAGSAERFELQEQIAECRAKLAELDEEDQHRRDATAAAPRAPRAPLAPTPAAPLAPTLRVGVTPGTLRVPTARPGASTAGPASGSAGILPARRRQAANGSGTPPPIQTPTTSAEGAAPPGRQDAGAPRAGAPSGGAPGAGAPGVDPTGVGARGTDAPPRIDLTHLPAGAPHFPGREVELAALDAALHTARPDVEAGTGRTAIVELVAPGGTGKTALIKRWLEGLMARGWGGTRRVYAWSFYSQGTPFGSGADRQASEDHFLAAALAWFAVAIAPSANPADKGQALAEALTQAPTLLLLDGCEPLQHPPGPLVGELCAPGLKALFAHLASAGRPGLCVLSTRERVRNLDEWVRGDAHPGGPVLRLDLANLSDTDGARLLHTLGAARAGAAPIAAEDPELCAASRAVQGHALTLSLLGNYLRLAHGGDIRRRDRVDLGAASAATGGHAFRVMAAYTHWLGQGGEPGAQALAALRLLGFFDRPASPDNLAALRAAPPIPGLTEALFTPPGPGATRTAATATAATGSAGVPPARSTGVPPATARVSVRVLGLARQFWQSLVHRTPPVGGGPAGSRRSQVEPIGDTQWRIALKRLEDAGLIAPPAAAHPAPADSLDAHPLVREYLAETLASDHSAAWREGHRRLYERLKGSAPHRPEGLDGLQPLYQAVAHGCRAGLWQEVKDEVYEDRILRGTGNDGFYSVKKLGAFGADLGAVACLFAEPWSRPAPALKESDRAWLLNQAAFSLRALGRLGEALEPMRAGAEMHVRQKDWRNAAIGYGNLSELQLTLGRPAEAVADAGRAVEYADRSGDAFQRLAQRTALADALHQRGETAQAGAGFAEAESMQSQRQSEYPLLYSLQGFRYCDLLLAAAERAAWSAHGAADGESAPAGPADACEAVAERARGAQRAWREIFTNPEPLLDIALDHLTLARCALYADRLASRPPGREAQDQTGRALNGLRAAGVQHHLPRALITRAWLRHAQGDPAGTAADLAEAARIASRGPMPLHLADCALHRARLFHDRAALTQARHLIETHGYGRRLPELADAEAAAAW